MISGHNQLILTASTSKRFFRWLIFLKNPVKTHAQKPDIDVGDNVILVTLWWWQFSEDGGRIIMLVAFTIPVECTKLVTNISNWLLTSQTCHQHFLSSTSVTNIDLTQSTRRVLSFVSMNMWKALIVIKTLKCHSTSELNNFSSISSLSLIKTLNFTVCITKLNSKYHKSI